MGPGLGVRLQLGRLVAWCPHWPHQALFPGGGYMWVRLVYWRFGVVVVISHLGFGPGGMNYTSIFTPETWTGQCGRPGFLVLAGA